VAQDAAVPKIAKPDLPTVSSAPMNTSSTDVPSVVQTIPVTASKPVPVEAPPATPAPPKKISLPVSEIPADLKSKVSIAAQHVRARQLAEALTLYNEILGTKPDLFTILVERGKVYQEMKDHTKAVDDFGSAIKNNGNHYEAYFHRCVSYHDTGAFVEAVADCSKAIELNPDAFEYYYYRGLAYTSLRTWDKAAADLAAATSRNNEQPAAHLQLARVYAETDQLIPALREYTVALQQRPGYPEAYKGRSAIKAALGDAIGSKEDLTKATP
jgi:tetratricopeptide (TPR) repeat protein